MLYASNSGTHGNYIERCNVFIQRDSSYCSKTPPYMILHFECELKDLIQVITYKFMTLRLRIRKNKLHRKMSFRGRDIGTKISSRTRILPHQDVMAYLISTDFTSRFHGHHRWNFTFNIYQKHNNAFHCICRSTSAKPAGKRYQKNPRTHRKTNTLHFIRKLIHIQISFSSKVIPKYTDHPSELIQTKTEPLCKTYSTKKLL